MSFVLSLEHLRLADQDRAGEKAARLGELIHAGFDVPDGICITADAYRTALEQDGVDSKILARLNAAEIDDPVDLETAAEEIRMWIENATLPANLAAEIQAALREQGHSTDAGQGTPFAVRASRIVEDVVNPRASGLEQAFLGIPGLDALLDHVRKCWATPWTSRAIYYRNRKKMDPRQVTMAVVIQPLLEAEAAGVMFTANPLTLAADEIHIDATWGLGEAVIAARWRTDHFVVDKASLALRDRTIALKNVMQAPAREGGLQTLTVAEPRQEQACLTDDQIVQLAETGRRVEAHFKQAQDIEWCRAGERMALLQTRPLRKK